MAKLQMKPGLKIGEKITGRYIDETDDAIVLELEDKTKVHLSKIPSVVSGLSMIDETNPIVTIERIDTNYRLFKLDSFDDEKEAE